MSHEVSHTHSVTPEKTTLGVSADESERLGAPEYSADDLGSIEQAAESTIGVLESALKNGEPRSSVIETDRGMKGVVDASVPGGSMEATFNGFGEGAEPEEIYIRLDEGQDGTSHGIAVKHMDMPPPEIFVDGTPVPPQDIPSVKAVIEQIQQEQNAAEADTGKNDEEPTDDKERKAVEELYKALDTLRVNELKHKSKVDELASRVQGMIRALNMFSGDGRGRVGFEAAARKTRSDLENIAMQLKGIQRTFEENQQDALRLQDTASSLSGEKMHIVKQSSDMTTPREAERRISNIDVRQSSYIGDILQELKRVMALLEQSAPMNARMLQAKIVRR